MELRATLTGWSYLAIVGVGSEIRNDDGVGIAVVNRLKEVIKNPKVDCLIGGTVPENLTGVLRRLKPSHILLIDAASTGQPPGTITLIDPATVAGSGFSTHSLSLKEMSAYLQHEIGAKVYVLGIEPKDLNFGEELSPEGRQAVAAAVALVEAALL